MLAAVVTTTLRGQLAPFVAVEVELDHRDRLSDDERGRGQLEIVLEHLPQSPELFAVSMGVDQRSVQQLFHRPVLRPRLTSRHGLLPRVPFASW